MARIRKTVLAEQDLEEIWLYIAADNVDAADTLIDEIVEKSVLLATNVELGHARPEIHEGLRSFPIGNYILFYRPEPGGIELARVLHGARDLGVLLFRDVRRGLSVARFGPGPVTAGIACKTISLGRVDALPSPGRSVVCLGPYCSY